MPTIVYERKDIDEKPNSALKRVTIFEGKAHVVRARCVGLAAGANEVVFSGLGKDIEEENLKANVADGAARVASVRLEKRNLMFFNKKENEETYRELVTALKELVALEDSKTILAIEARLIADLRSYIQQALAEILLEQNVAITRLKEALDFLRELLDKNRNTALKNDRELARMEQQYNRLIGLLAQVRKIDKKETHLLHLVIEAQEALDVEIEVAYTLSGASWRTSYDASLDTSGKRLVLSVYGEITQSSGEEWENAEIVLSSAVSDSGIAIPEIYPVSLSGYEEKISRDIVMETEGTKELTATNEETTEIPEPRQEATSVAKKGTSSTFTVAEPGAIPADGLPHRLLIRRDELGPELCFETIPERMEYVYLKALFKNAAAAPLLPGPVRIFRNKSYIGRTETAYVAAGEECALSFGIDEDIKVKRIVLKDEYSPPRGLGARHTREFSYRYILTHYKDTAVEVVLREPVHLSEVDKVTVKIESDTSPGCQVDRNGIASFTVGLPAGKFERTSLLLHYTIEAPRSFSLENV
jgi:uncharacterized protein (TIGR02231 family)